MDVVVSVERGELDTVRAALTDYGAAVLEDVPVDDHRSLVVGRVANEATATAAALHARRLGLAAITRPIGGGRLSAWNRNNDAIVIDHNLTICLPWSDPSGRTGPHVVEIDPGASFGAGRHPTTRLLLGELSRRIRGNERVLDVGCGSGVLGIAAAMLGAESVLAIDVEDGAVATTAANAERNGVGSLVSASTDRLDAIDSVFDVIVANIHAPILTTMAPTLLERLGPGGWLGLSGLSAAQAPSLAAALADLTVEAPIRLDDWVALIAHR